MKAARFRTVIVTVIEDNDGGGNFFSVQDGESICTHLCWDEMLGAVVSLTHPQITRVPYLRVPDTVVDDLERRAKLWGRKIQGPAPLLKFEELPL